MIYFCFDYSPFHFFISFLFLQHHLFYLSLLTHFFYIFSYSLLFSKIIDLSTSHFETTFLLLVFSHNLPDSLSFSLLFYFFFYALCVFSFSVPIHSPMPNLTTYVLNLFTFVKRRRFHLSLFYNCLYLHLF